MSALRRPVRAIGSAAALKDLLAQVFPGEEIRLPPHADALLRLHAPLPDQRPATCGAYVLTYVLAARGFTELDGEPLGAEDYIAHLEQLTIRADEDPSGYRFPVSASADPGLLGSSPEGVARAVAAASRGRLATVPVPGRDSAGSPQLDGRRWEALLDVVASRFIGDHLDVIFNYEADQLLGARDEAYNAKTLGRADAAAVIPRDRWGVGHFATMAALWRRPSRERWMVLLNSFKERAFAGCEPQPAELMRRGVVRDDGRGGGALLLVRREEAGPLIKEIEDIGLAIGMWSNGSQAPRDWQWSPGR
jgi:uncharacterized protein DUF6885